MSADVILCSGCCCGNLQKGHDEVPIDFLQDLWQKNQLEDNVKLTISGCLGACSKRNVAVLNTDEGLIWLGGLSSQLHYEALAEWASEYSKNDSNTEILGILDRLQFTREKELKLSQARLHNKLFNNSLTL
tara:strand:+ start:1444 stop:1836 length:393 start_codon:yes stop_codon:yes gene_type:complete